MNPYELSIYDPTKQITAGRVGQYVKSLAVIGGNLVAEINGVAEPINLGQYRGAGGAELSTATIVDERIVFTLSNGATYQTDRLPDAMIKDVIYAGTGLFVGASGSAPSTDVASNGMYHLIPTYPNMLVVNQPGTAETAEGVLIRAGLGREQLFAVSTVISRLAPNGDRCFIFPGGTPADKKYIEIVLPLLTAVSGVLLMNLRTDFGTANFRLDVSDDGIAWTTVLTDTLARNTSPVIFEFQNDVKAKIFRLWCVTGWADGGLGRFDLLTRDAYTKHSPFNRLTYVLDRDPPLISETRTEALTKEGVNLKATSSLSTSYNCSSVLKRLGEVTSYAGTYIFADAGIARMWYEFPFSVAIAGVLLANGQLSAASKDVEIATSDDGVVWTPAMTYTMPYSTSLVYARLPNVVHCKYIRLELKTKYQSYWGIRRFDPLVSGSVSALNHKPLVLDPSYFSVTELEDRFEVSRTSTPAPTPVSDSQLAYSDYSRFEWKAPSTSLAIPAGGNSTGTVIPFGNAVVNNANLKMKSPTLLLAKGRWKIAVSMVVTGVGSGYLFLQDTSTRAEIARGISFSSGPANSVDQHIVSAEFDVNCHSDNTPVVLKLYSANQTTFAASTETTVITQLWRVSDPKAPNVVPIADAVPAGLLAKKSEIYHISGTLASSSNGSGLFDDAPAGGTWNAVGHNVIVTFKNPVRLWRQPLSTATTSFAKLGILRLDDGVDYSNDHLTLTNAAAGTWSQFTGPLPAGTYAFRYLGVARADGEWFAENIVDYVSLVDALPAMTGYSAPGVTVSASSEYDGVYVAWKAFQKVFSSNNADNWLSAPGAISEQSPAWLQVVFDQPTEIRAYQIWNGADPHPIKGELLGSNDGDVWDVLHTFDVPAPANFSWRDVYHLTTIGSYTRYRLAITQQSAATFVGVGDLILLKRKD